MIPKNSEPVIQKTNQSQIKPPSKSSSTPSSSISGIFFDNEESDENESVEKMIPKNSEPVIQNTKQSQIKLPSKSSSTPSSSISGIFFGEDSDENASGGTKSNESNSSSPNTSPEMYEINPTGMSLHNPFYKRLVERDPDLFLKEPKKGMFNSYARICAANLNKQPVILTDSEKEKIDKEHPGSYTHSFKYGSNPNKQYHYICPRYWCLKTNTSLTEAEVKSGICGKVIPPNAKTVPKDAFVYEFSSQSEHIDVNGKYIQHYPGFASKTCMPCCYKKHWDSSSQVERRNECMKKDNNLDNNNKNVKKDANKLNLYVISIETYPIRQKKRWGFLPMSVQLFLQTNNEKCISKDNPALIKPNTPCLLRYGVEQIKNQSFLGCIADLYVHVQGIKTSVSVFEIKKILTETITLDNYIQYHNGSLVAIFKPLSRTSYIDIDTMKYENTTFYKNINKYNETQVDLLEDTVASYESFMRFLLDENATIDHTYLWDIVIDNNPKLIKGGVNLVIIEIINNDITDKIEIVCPTNSYSKRQFDPRKETFIILKHDEFYEPIYLYEDITTGINIKRLFSERSTTLKNIKQMILTIQNTTNKYCSPLPSMPKIYKYKQNHSLLELTNILKSYVYSVKFLIMNYQNKIIGVIIETPIEQVPVKYMNAKKVNVFIPCFPSGLIKELNDIPIKFMDDDNIWIDYETTRDVLTNIHHQTNGQIYCLPKMKVFEDNLIVGILTETNQFVQIDPPAEDVSDDVLIPVRNTINYNTADKIITSSKVNPDIERIKTVKKIELESQFYSVFRSIVRNLMNTFENREIKQKITLIFDNPYLLYKQKIKKIETLIKKIVSHAVIFNDIDDDVLYSFEEILECSLANCDKQQYCLKKKNGVCMLIVSKKNLVSGEDNEPIYFGRIADELVRYSRIRVFMMQPKNFLNITNADYKINHNEILLMQSLLNPSYFNKMIPFSSHGYINNINYEIAEPDITQTYTNDPISLDDQYKEPIDNRLNDNLIECIQDKREIIGRMDNSIWKRSFPKVSKEIIFKNTSPNCSFYIIIYILQEKLKTPVLIQDLKKVLWDGYKGYMETNKKKILHLLKIQGKKQIVDDIKNKKYSLDTAIFSENYYITNLDIWILSKMTNTPICLFASTHLKGFVTNIDWVLLNLNYKERYYFIRSPIMSEMNQIPKYHLITGAYKFSELGDFGNIVQNALSGTFPELKEHVQTFDSYLKNYTVISKKNK